MKIQLFRKQRGVSLLEVMLSLAIIAIILVMAARYFGLASNTSKLNLATNQINEIIQGLTQWQNNQGNYTNANLTNLYDQGFITQQTSTGINSWGGHISVAAASNTATITFTNVPVSACKNLSNRMGTAQSSCSGSTYSYLVNAQTP